LGLKLPMHRIISQGTSADKSSTTGILVPMDIDADALVGWQLLHVQEVRIAAGHEKRLSVSVGPGQQTDHAGRISAGRISVGRINVGQPLHEECAALAAGK
jgi:hypothetical protein